MMNLFTWFIYSCVLPLSPVPLVYFASWLTGTRKRLATIVRDGQVCFYCTTLSAVCINDVVKAASGNPLHATAGSVALAIAGLLLSMVLSTFTYGVAATSTNPTGVDEIKLGITSAATAFTTTLIVVFSREAFGLL